MLLSDTAHKQFVYCWFCQPFCKARTDADVAEAQRDFSTFLQLLVNWRDWKMDLKTKMYLEAVLKIPFLLQKKLMVLLMCFCPTNQCSPTKTSCFIPKFPYLQILLPSPELSNISYPFWKKGHRFWVEDLPAETTRLGGISPKHRPVISPRLVRHNWILWVKEIPWRCHMLFQLEPSGERCVWFQDFTFKNCVFFWILQRGFLQIWMIWLIPSFLHSFIDGLIDCLLACLIDGLIDW